MLVHLVLQALLREPRAEGATRVPPPAMGRVLGLDRAPEVKTVRRKLAGLAAAGKAADLQMAIAQRRAAASPDDLGFLYIDGHTRAYFGTREIQKMHVARLKFPGPATEETWVTDGAGDPLLVVMAEPSASLAAQIKELLPSCAQSPDRMTASPSCALTGAAGPRTCSPRSSTPGSTCSPTARPAPGKTSRTCPRTRSPPPSTPATTAASTATSWPTAPPTSPSPAARTKDACSPCGRSPAWTKAGRSAS